MQVSVRLFAALRERAGADVVRLELPDGARVADALERLKGVMTHPIIVDGRNLLDPAAVANSGFTYIPSGRPGGSNSSSSGAAARSESAAARRVSASHGSGR